MGAVPNYHIVTAAIQMNARLANVQANLEKADKLTDEAFARGAKLVVLPEFFTSGVAFHPSMINAALPFEGKALELLTTKAKKFNGMVGGSFLAIKSDGERYNTFVLAFPDGRCAAHDKDLPTMWENCYYTRGKDPGILETPLGPIGAALCWEFIRTQTARRLESKIDLLVGGSCWWTAPEKGFSFPFKKTLRSMNLEIMKQTPSRMARILGVPVVHAAHAGEFEGYVPCFPGLKIRSYYLGESQIVDNSGNILSRMSREQGEGVIFAKLTLGRRQPSEPIPKGFWIPKLHPIFKILWHYQNFHGRQYYRLMKKQRGK